MSVHDRPMIDRRLRKQLLRIFFPKGICITCGRPEGRLEHEWRIGDGTVSIRCVPVHVSDR
jgi:hypothetical protein